MSFDPHFRNFATSLEGLITGYDSEDTDMTTRQRKQVEGLVALEKKFRQALIRDWRGPAVYKAFVKYIVESRRNILAARPYFRERQDVFKTQISPVLRDRQDKALYAFNINYPFIAFALKAKKFGAKSRVVRIANEVEAARRELIITNLPLAISRARIFKQKVPASHLDYMDLVQISNEGLISAVDKFVLPYTPVFRSVIIGRITGNLIEDYSDTMLHFYPSDKRKIYRANKAQKTAQSNWDDVATAVNRDVDPQYKTTPAEVQQLMSAAGHVSLDIPVDIKGDGAATTAIDRHKADANTRPDIRFEDAQTHDNLRQAVKVLSVFERKILDLKGISV